jgi:hypothetical protein
MGARTTKWMVLSATVAALLSGCTTTTARMKPASTPRVLIIGDSISIGYFEPTKQLLEGKAEVHHNPGNAAHTRNCLAQLDAWLDPKQANTPSLRG